MYVHLYKWYICFSFWTIKTSMSQKYDEKHLHIIYDNSGYIYTFLVSKNLLDLTHSPKFAQNFNYTKSLSMS